MCNVAHTKQNFALVREILFPIHVMLTNLPEYQQTDLNISQYLNLKKENVTYKIKRYQNQTENSHITHLPQYFKNAHGRNFFQCDGQIFAMFLIKDGQSVT